MGRIGAGEATTLLLACAGPLFHLGIGAWLLVAGRRAKNERRPLGPAAFYVAAAAIAVVLVALAITAIELVSVFGTVAHAPAVERSAILALGISESMNLFAFGVVISLALYAVSTVLLGMSRRAQK